MSNKKVRAIQIKYTSREFDSIRSDLVDYVKRYYPNTYRDFNEASFGSLMIDTVSYIGDILSFYIDYQANESFLYTAVEYNNVVKLGRQLGYKFKTAASSYGIATFYIMIPAQSSGLGPDKRYMPVLRRGSTFNSGNGGSFILNEDVHFGNPANEIRVARQSEETGLPTSFAVKAFGEVVSGEYTTEQHVIGDFIPFRTIRMTGLDAADIISVMDLEGNEYHEVDYLSQNVIYRGITNRNKTAADGTEYSTSIGEQASEVLKPFMVPRRFSTNREARRTILQFGASSDVSLPKDMIADPSSVIMRIPGKNYITDESFDPTRLIQSDKFGVAPSSTTLTIRYRKNTIENVNCRVGQLNNIGTAIFEFDDISSLNLASIKYVKQSIEVDNEFPITGDVKMPSIVELKHRIYDTFATQNRAVTQQDYESVVYQMPRKFGGIKRCKIMRDHDSFKRNLNLYVVSEDEFGNFTRTNRVVKKNLKTWLQKNKMINDTIDIMDAKVVNIGIRFVAISTADSSKADVLEEAYSMLRVYYSRKADIGESLFITDIYRELKKVPDLLDVTEVTVYQKYGSGTGGRSYSDIRFDVDKATSADGRYIEIPKNVVYELKYGSTDIDGVIV